MSNYESDLSPMNILGEAKYILNYLGLEYRETISGRLSMSNGFGYWYYPLERCEGKYIIYGNMLGSLYWLLGIHER